MRARVHEEEEDRLVSTRTMTMMIRRRVNDVI